MANHVDERVVQMYFDNDQFERGVQESIKSLDNLRGSIDKLDNSANSLTELQKVSKGFDTSGITSGIDNVKNGVETLMQKLDELTSFRGRLKKFVEEDIIGTLASKVKSAYAQISDIVGMGAVKGGMSKYEEQTKAVQTITNATGKSVAEVEETLQELMHYTDETSYDFSTMVSSIGKFTSVGVDLKVAEKAMEGIANEAALSGAGVQEANRAMYNFAQALSAGHVKLIDWKSIENANMATKEFKEQLIQTAIETGVLSKKTQTSGTITKGTGKNVKQVTVDYKTFNETLKDEWLTSDVLIQTLEKYADKDGPVGSLGRRAYEAAQKALTFTDAINAIKDSLTSGWMQSLKYIFGDLDEAIELWTNFCNAVIEATSAIDEWRNTLLRQWHNNEKNGLTGYQMTIEAISNLWKGVLGIIENVGDAITKVFPLLTSRNLISASEKLLEFSESFKKTFQFGGTEEKTVKRVVNQGVALNKELKTAEEIKALQKQLNRKGYGSMNNPGGLELTGKFDEKTKYAIKRLQRALGVETTGIWDEATRNAAAGQKAFYQVFEVTEEVEIEPSETAKSLNGIIEGLAHVAKIAADAIGALWNAIKYMGQVISPLIDPFLRMFDVIGSWLGVTDESIRKTKFWSKELETFKSFLKPIADKIKTFSEGMMKFWSDPSVRTFPGFIKKLKNQFKDNKVFQIFLGIFDKINQIIIDVKVNTWAFFRRIYEWFRDDFPAVWESVKQFTGAIIDNINKSGMLKTVWNGIKKGFQIVIGVLGLAVTGIQAAFEKLKEFFDFDKYTKADGTIDIFGAIKDKFVELKDSAVKTFDEIKKVLSERWAKLKEKYPFLQSIEDVVSGSAKKLQDLWDRIKKAFSTVFGGDSKLDENASFLDKIKEKLSAFGPVVDWFKEQWNDLFGFITEKWTKLKGDYPIFQTIEDFLTGSVEQIKNLFGLGGSGDGEETVSILDKFKNKLTEVKGSLGGLFGEQGILGTIGSGISGFISLIETAIEKIQEFFKTVGDTISVLFGLSANAEDNEEPYMGVVIDDAIGAADTVNGKSGDIKNAVGTITDAGNQLSQSLEEISKVKDGALEGTGKGGFFDTLLTNISGLVEKAKGIKIGDLLGPAVVGILGYMGISIAKGIKSLGKGIGAGAEALGSGGKLIGESIQAFMGKSNIGDIAKMFVDGLGNAMKTRPKDSIGTTFLKVLGSFSIAIATIAGAVALLSIIDIEKAKAGVELALEFIAGMVGALTEGSLFAKQAKDVGLGALMMAGSIGVLALGLWAMTQVIGNTNPKLLQDSILLILGLIEKLKLMEIEIILASKGTEGAKTVDVKIQGIFAMCAGVGVLVFAIGHLVKIIRENTYTNVENAFEKVKSLLTSLGNIELELAGVSKFAGSGPIQISGILSMCVGIGIIAFAIGKMVKDYSGYGIKYEAVFDMVKELIGKFGDLELEIGVANKVGNGGALKFGGILSMCIGIGVLAFAISKIAEDYQNYEKYEVALEAVKSFIDTLSGALFFGGTGLKALSTISLGGALNTGGVLAIISGIGLIFGAIQDLVKENLGFDVRGTIAEGTRMLGSAIGGFIHGLFHPFEDASKEAETSEDMFDKLKAIGEKLTNVLDSFEPFLEKVKGVSRESTVGVKNLVSALLAMSGAELLDNIANWVGSPFQAMNSLQTGKLKKGSGSAYIDFVDNLLVLAPKVTDLSNSFDGINTEALNTAAEGFYGLRLIADRITEMTWEQVKQDILSIFLGDQNILTFVEGLIPVLRKMRVISVQASHIDVEPLDAAATTLHTLASIASEIPATGGWLQDIFGTVKMDKFASQLGALGGGLVTFAETVNVESVDGFDAEKPVKVLQSLVDIVNQIPAVDGLMQRILGTQDGKAFATDIYWLGQGLVDFSAFANQIDDSEIQKMIDEDKGPLAVLRLLNTFEKELDKKGGFWSKHVIGEAHLGQFGTEISELGQHLVFFINSTKDLESMTHLEQIGKTVSALATALVEATNATVYSGGKGWGALDALLDIYLADTSWIDRLKGFSETVADKITTGLNDNESKPISAIDKLAGHMGLTLRSYYNAFEQAGRYLDDGLMMGLYNNSSKVTAMASRVAQAAYDRAARTLDLHSPSKKFAYLGEMADKGLINGFDAYSAAVGKSSENVAETALANARMGLSAISDVLADDIDESPTIAPVLDLSDFETMLNEFDPQGLTKGLESVSQVIASDIDTSPTITPVLDLSVVSEQAGQISSMIGNQTIGLSSSYSAGRIADSELSQTMQEVRLGVAALESIHELTSQLNERVDKLGAQMSRMQVVMDTGTLVGAITPAIDRSLGRRKQQATVIGRRSR